MTNDKQTEKFVLKNRRAISPILATVVLLGITVVAGGLVFSLFSTSAASSANTDVIAIQNAQAVKGTNHADITATVKNAGSQPWTSIDMTVGKTELSEPILYESLHENVVGCNADSESLMNSDGICTGIGDGSEGAPDGNRDNPMRAQWLISLDKESGNEEDVADKGEGAAVGRKLVFQSTDDLRTIQVLNGTAVAPLFGGTDQNGNQGTTGYLGNIDTTDFCDVGTSSTFIDCTDVFTALDASTDGFIYCQGSTDDDIAAVCKVFTHTNIKDSPISPGQSVYFYADAFTNEIPGLHNQVVRVGDNIVVNISSENGDGGTARVQTIIKVAGT